MLISHAIWQSLSQLSRIAYFCKKSCKKPLEDIQNKICLFAQMAVIPLDICAESIYNSFVLIES